ncbi:MAG: toll/interleukin-1 receptor domain-containing protein [Bacteroidales bacterium]|jgi:hypothetical protein|nr:toll/interleukin-1 receptor domain-containing protein [Bacteroidales bacterium]
MKPKIFLSHNKKDKDFIVKIANDLRSCGVDVWYDEWEIPPGESLRKKIFEDGISSCDVFFVYLTPNSIDSVWVQRELDSALVHEMSLKDSFLLLYVDNDTSRDRLTMDLKTLNIPEFNNENYLIPFGKMLSKTWNVYSNKLLRQQNKESKIEILELENKILKLNQNSTIDFEKINTLLNSKIFEIDDRNVSLFTLFVDLKSKLADGCNEYQIIKQAQNYLVIEDEDLFINPQYDKFRENYNVSDFTGDLIINGLVEIKTDQELNQFYYLTRQGIDFINHID